MLCVGFELTIPVFERAKTVHALDRATAVIGPEASTSSKYNFKIQFKLQRKYTTKETVNTAREIIVV
jgi:hypothetical protein